MVDVIRQIIGGGGSSSFTPVYGGYRNAGASVASNTITAGNNIPTNITVATLAAKASSGITLVAGGGLRNTSGETGVFECTFDFAYVYSNNSGASFDFGWRVRETDDVTYGSLVIGSNGTTYTGANPISPSFTSIVTLAPNETAFAGFQNQTGGATTIVSNGSATIKRIA